MADHVTHLSFVILTLVRLMLSVVQMARDHAACWPNELCGLRQISLTIERQVLAICISVTATSYSVIRIRFWGVEAKILTK